jgi:hypothetical protein
MHSLSGGGTASVNVAVASGWNLISNPVLNAMPGDSVRQLFPTSTNAYAFEFSPGTGYAQRYTLENGEGYWEKFSSGGSTGISGAPLLRDTVNVVAGWNIIGSLSSVVDTSTIVTIPPGLRVSNWFGYSAGYQPVVQLVPGLGAWVKTSGAGKVVLASTGDGRKDCADNLLQSLNTLLVSEQGNGSQTLYFGVDGERKIDVSSYDLPPLPPAGAFDARFVPGRMLELAKAGTSKLVPIVVSGAKYPLTLSWEMRNVTMAFVLVIGTVEFSMTGSGSISVNDVDASLAIRFGGTWSLPKAFALTQNYPNPFNPSTTIKYDLPIESRVSLKVFDILGREVATLVNEDQKAGYKSTVWNGAGLASGIYYYRLQAGDFTATRKLLLLK